MVTLSMIVKASDEEAKLLDRCLKYASPYFDELNITITGENQACEDVCEKYMAKVSHFKWVGDFSKARNFNFSKATGEYIMWLDCDDILKNGHLIKDTVSEMKENHIDAVILPYLYDFDENGLCTVRHLKTRIIKNDGTFKWAGALHEDFESNREIRQFLDEKIEVMHLKTGEQAEESSIRNLDIAKICYKKDKNDPRNVYLMANAYLSLNNEKEAIKYLKRFVDMSQSDEEKYLAYLNIFDVTKDTADITKAWLLRPAYPNVYFKLGEYFYKNKELQRARQYIELGLQMPKPDDSIIVFNPREYDYVPLMLMVNICFELGEYSKALATIEVIQKIYPKDKTIKDMKKVISDHLGDVLRVDDILEELSKITDKKYLKKRLEKLPDSIKSHPKIAYFRNENFIKEESSGKDLVYYCSYTSKEWSPLDTAVGGSEEAVINLSKELFKMGWNVTVYNNCGKNAGIYDGVKYLPFWEYNHRDKQDVTIIWRHPRFVDFLDERAGKVFIDMHDVIPAGEFTRERLDKIRGVFVKSKAHQKILELGDVITIPNGVNLDQFKQEVERNPYLVLNTSSADRHLESTLDVFEELIKRQPDKPWKLAWYYGWGVYDFAHANDKSMMDWKQRQVDRFEKLKADGRAEGGVMLNHEDVAKKYLEAGVFLYPTQFYEIDCISARKAQIAGCGVVTSDFAALDETVEFGTKIHTKGERWGKENTFGDPQTDKYIDAILKAKSSSVMGWGRQFEWSSIAKKWNEKICE